MRSKTSRIAKTLPAWALVGLLVVLGSGCMWGPSYYYPACGNPCGYRATIDIDQENYGTG